MYPNLLGQKVYRQESNEDLAALLGITRRTLEKKLESGKFTAIECRTLCEHYGKSFEYLFATNDEIR